MEYRGYPTPQDQLDARTRDAQLMRALLYGLAGGAVGGAIWYGVVRFTEHELGLVAVALGWLVGQGVVLGSGGRRGMRLQLLSVAITVAAMAVSYYFIVRDVVVAYVGDTYGAAAVGSVPLLLPFEDAFDFVTASLSDDPIELLFCLIAVYAAFRVPRLLAVASAPAKAGSAS